jgi:hypothetical protein
LLWVRRLRLQLSAKLAVLVAATFGAAIALWHWLRGFAGDAAYEGYLRHAGKDSVGRLSAQEFYLENMQRKYTRPNRCC